MKGQIFTLVVSVHFFIRNFAHKRCRVLYNITIFDTVEYSVPVVRPPNIYYHPFDDVDYFFARNVS